MRYLFLCVALLTVGCVPPGNLSRVPGQDEAEDLVWRGFYRAEGSPLPTEWRLSDCQNPKGPGIRYPEDDTCGSGFTYSGFYVVLLWTDAKGLRGSSYAHEMMHVLQHTRGYDDANHEIVADWSLAKEAAAALKEMPPAPSELP